MTGSDFSLLLLLFNVQASFSGIRLVLNKQVEIHSVFLGFGVYSFMCNLPDVCSQHSMLKRNPAMFQGLPRRKWKGLRAKPKDKSNCIQCVPLSQLWCLCICCLWVHMKPRLNFGSTEGRTAFLEGGAYYMFAHTDVGYHTLHRSLWSPLQTVALW